ncbi:hypothetical protein XM38_022820 [Halomicronema hongdechloris C2206]|uniref:Uncharacterized protein n=1 Tax=Halomicronema hongdechloris C2206 TaxID=1641165 RepID=A0A1Z3HM09_9CYAN|nr:hypothetical protein [Halomicronema hongdechloris]ASC71330.1 hypothetical protein XM38_022820 [Halomicronema hongdechloris C2206]
MISLLVALSSSLPAPSLAQAENPCQNTDTVLPAEDTRRLTLEQFGVALSIPANYRAILRNDGSVQVVDPGTYNLIRCQIQGGDLLGRGFSELVIRQVDAAAEDSLETVVRDAVYAEAPGPRPSSCISPYPLQGQQGYLVQTPTGRHAEFWLHPPNTSTITVLETSCDCQGMVDRLIEVLETTELLAASASP